MRKIGWLLIVGMLGVSVIHCATQEESTETKANSSSADNNESAESDQTAASGDSADDESADNQSDSTTQTTDDLPYRATGPVAVIDGEEITADEYNEIVRKQHAGSGRQMAKQMASRMKSDTLDAVIDKHLIERELAKHDLEVTDEELAEEYEKFSERFPNEEAKQSFFKTRDTSEKEIKRQMEKDLKLKEILRKRGDIEISDTRAKSYYDNNPGEFEQKEQVKARHILIETASDASEEDITNARKEAEELSKKARQEDTDFATLAENHSDGPSAEKGGDLGFFTRGRIVPEFSDKAFSMENGEISGPVKTKFGFHVIKREDHKPAGKKSFDEVKSEIVQKIEKKQFRTALDAYLSELKQKADIQRKVENIEINEEATGEGAKQLPGKENLKLKMKEKK